MNNFKSTNKIQKFLLKRFKDNNPLKQDFIKVTKINKSTVSNIINGKHHPDILTLIKISLYFKISLDKLFKRHNDCIFSEAEQFNNKLLSLEYISINLKKFLIKELEVRKLDSSTLGLTLGFSGNPIYNFLKENSKQKILRSNLIVVLADYLEVSIDEMIGRVSLSNQKLQQNIEKKFKEVEKTN